MARWVGWLFRRVRGWRGAGRVPVVDLAPPEGRGEIQGLLGSDVLSEFGRITVDYEDGALRLPPR